ncbi:hypothetical protein MRX96_031753 [Rhipicephalus microplus]
MRLLAFASGTIMTLCAIVVPYLGTAARLSVADAMVMRMAYSTSAGLNWKDIEKLAHVINLLMGAEVLPSSQYLL